jgi:hypothetical protein
VFRDWVRANLVNLLLNVTSWRRLMNRTLRIVLSSLPLVLVASLVWTGTTQAAQIGVWQFDNNLNNGLPGRAAMSVFGGWTETYAGDTIGGNPATVLSFPAMAADTQSLQMPNEAGANGGGTQTNTWTIVMDLKFPTIPGFISLWQTDQNIGANDGDFFINGSGGIGISGNYHGTVTANNWHRIAVAVSRSGTNAPILNKYIDGSLVGTTTPSGSLDDRHAVKAVLNLFGDEDGETGAGLVNSIAYYNTALSANEIGALGGATAGGIPAVPEPGSLALATVGLACVGARRRGRSV